jgi:hypothetical protein
LQHGRSGRILVAASLVAAAVLLSACSASTIGDHLPTAIGGLPEGTPQRPATPAAYPAVHDLPPKRDDTMLSYEEQKKLEDDLIAARTRAAGAAGVPADKAAADSKGKSKANSKDKSAGGSGNP